MSDILTVQDTSLTAIADEIRKKTGKKDKIKFPAGFVSEIDSIQTGGGSAPAEEIKESDVNFFDYDGTLIASYTEAEAKTLTTLPTPPEHSGLVFQGWNYTLQEIIDNADAADIGALYTTDDGATRLEIEIASESRKDMKICFYQSKQSGVLIDWGDGNSERSAAVTGPTFATHDYEATGHYTIKLTVDDDCEVKLGQHNGGVMVSFNASAGYYYKAELLSVNIGNHITGLNAGAFQYSYGLSMVSMTKGITSIDAACFKCSAIRYITIPAGIDTIDYDTFNECYELSNISLPVSMQNVGNNAFRACSILRRIDIKRITNPGSYVFAECNNLKEISLKEEITYIPNGILAGCKSLARVEFLGNVKMLYSYALRGCTSIKTVDFTHCTAVPTAQSEIFYNYPSDLEILVPAALADEWKQATNWTALASKINGV